MEFVNKGITFVSAAPKKWLNGSQCWWPKKDKEGKAIKESHDPCDDWSVMADVTVLGEYGKYCRTIIGPLPTI